MVSFMLQPLLRWERAAGTNRNGFPGPFWTLLRRDKSLAAARNPTAIVARF